MAGPDLSAVQLLDSQRQRFDGFSPASEELAQREVHAPGGHRRFLAMKVGSEQDLSQSAAPRAGRKRSVDELDYSVSAVPGPQAVPQADRQLIASEQMRPPELPEQLPNGRRAFVELNHLRSSLSQPQPFALQMGIKRISKGHQI